MTFRAAREGFTLVELLVALVVASIVGLAAIRFVLFDARMGDNREAWRTARQAARSGVTALTADLRMVENKVGVEAVSADGLDITVRVPYAFGLLCSTNGTTSTVALLPADSLMFAAPGFSGFAWRDTTTRAYTYVTAGTTLTTGASAAPCTTAGVTVLPAAGGSPAGKVVSLGGTVPNTLAPTTVVLLFRRVRYRFQASAAYPGKTGLWRTLLATGQTDELAAPFDASARFSYYVGKSLTSQDAVPASLATISGFELRLNGNSVQTPRGSTGPKVVALSTAVFFQNQTY